MDEREILIKSREAEADGAERERRRQGVCSAQGFLFDPLRDAFDFVVTGFCRHDGDKIAGRDFWIQRIELRIELMFQGSGWGRDVR